MSYKVTVVTGDKGSSILNDSVLPPRHGRKHLVLFS